MAYVQTDNKKKTLEVLVKSKSRAAVFIDKLATILAKGNVPLSQEEIINFLSQQSFANAEQREVQMYRRMVPVSNPDIEKNLY